MLNQVKWHVYLATHYILAILQWQSLNNLWLTSGCNAPATQSPVITPAPIVTQYVALLELSLPITLAQFDSAEQDLFRANGCCCWIAAFRRRVGGNLLCSIIQTQTYCGAAGQRYHQYAQRQASPAVLKVCSRTYYNKYQALSAVGLPAVSVIACMYIVPFCIARFTFS